MFFVWGGENVRVGVEASFIYMEEILRSPFCVPREIADARAMKILSNLFVSFSIGIIANFGNLENVRSEKTSSTIDLIVLVLHRDVKFLYDRPEQMNVDAIFGLNFVQVHVTAALQNNGSAIILGEKNRRMAEEILSFCKIAKKDGRKITRASGLERIVRPEIWNRTIIWKRDELFGNFSTNHRLRRIHTAYPINRGTPSEFESSSCFVDLLAQDENFGCAVSKKCAAMLVRKDSPRGYPLTHRLLYVQLATALRCKENQQIRFEEMKKNFCTTIFQHLLDLESMNFPSFSRDLAMEQIALCGMEGYLEFANEHYGKLITSWPNSHGCFSAFGYGEFHRNERNIRHKRSSSFMDYGCDNHASGVAAASLSLLLRSYVENTMLEITEKN